MDSLSLLFAEVGQLPFLTSVSQEFWLGIQNKAPQNWGELDSYDDCTLLAAIYASVRMRFSQLEIDCTSVGITVPGFEVWIAEILNAYQNIYKLQRSCILRFAKSSLPCQSEVNRKLLAKVYDLAELLCLFPEPALSYLSNISQGHGAPPSMPQFCAWTKQCSMKRVWQLAEDRAKQARTTLVTGYLRYVLRIARNAIGQGIDYLDLVQEGVLGLMRAAERFNYREGARFAVFASSWIWQGISRALADQGRTIRLPVHMYERVCTLQDSLRKHAEIGEVNAISITLDCFSLTSDPQESEDNGVNDEAVGKPQTLTVRKMRRKAYRMLEYCQSLVPLDLELSDNLFERMDFLASDSVTLTDCIFDQNSDVETIILHHEWTIMLQRLLQEFRSISSRDVEILRLRYGLDDGREYTLEEIGQRFNLTRERVRQIEFGFLKKLRLAWQAKYGAIDFSETIYPLIPMEIQKHIEICTDTDYTNPDDFRQQEQRYLDHYLMRLPGGDWHSYRIANTGTRYEQVITAMQILEAPAHYSVIAEQITDITANTTADANNVYSMLMRYEDTFTRLGEGYFSLAEWERQRAAKPEPVLPFCPMALPDPPNQPNAFLESVMIARELLQKPLNAEALLHSLAAWANLGWPQPRWICQSALFAYYAIGMLPCLFYEPAVDQPVALTLPEADLLTLRIYCLDMLSKRVQAMAEFWWLLQRHQPIRVTELAQLFVKAHPLGLDDVANRLALLAGIGAVQKSSYGGRYQLTQLGETMATRWAQQPTHFGDAICDSLVEEQWDFVDFSFE